MKLLEQFVLGKLGDAELCEDVLVATDDFVAVIDGTTDRTGWTYAGRLGGRAAADVCAAAIRALPADATAVDAVLEANRGFRAFADQGPDDGPSAAMTVYSAARREVWSVGDVAYGWSGMSPRDFVKAIDRASSELRAATLQTYLNQGASVDELRADDPAREVIQPFLDRQYLLRNATSAWSYGALDGRPVPAQHLEIVAVPVDVAELVIATDGYPHIRPTLAEAEAELARLLAIDPLCMRELIGPKPVQPGALSFDDRAYTRIAL
jgi:hypothetical protein